MLQKKILVPLWTWGRDLKSVHYALALAQRIQAKVYILQKEADPDPESREGAWLEEALLDLINSARQAGLVVSHYLTHSNLEEEIVDLIRDEEISLLVFGEDDGVSERLLLQVKPLIPIQIIQVKEKDHISYL